MLEDSDEIIATQKGSREACVGHEKQQQHGTELFNLFYMLIDQVKW